MSKKTISAIILATSLSLVGGSYAVAANQQAMRNGQNCANQTEEMANSQNCMKKSGEMKHKGKHHGNKQAHKQGNKNSKKQGKNNQYMGFAKLDLSADQKQKIDAIMENIKTENQKLKLANRASMQALMASETFDTDAARSLITYQQQQKSEKKLAMMKAKHEVLQLLTDEQKTKYSEMKMKRQNR